MSDKSFLSRLPDPGRPLLEVKGIDLVERLGMEAVRGVVCDIMAGVNVRTATEALTRKRITLLNVALLVMYLRAQRDFGPLGRDVTSAVRAELELGGMPPSEKRVLWWMLGLTKKQIDNVLRSDPDAWDDYIEKFSDAISDTVKEAEKTHGELNGSLSVGGEDKQIPIDWRWAIHLMTAVGAQTLATRGSEKSMYGKFFEKLILGGILHVLGLRLISEGSSVSDNVYWLSSRGRKRESDATALFDKGIGIRFDIGFIGVGNTEISLDKVSRFEREIEMGGKSKFMHTIIIVDRIGDRSRIVELAKEIDGTILQMSSKNWPIQLAAKLEEIVDGFESPFKEMDDEETVSYIRKRITTAPFDEILKIVQEEPNDNDPGGDPEAPTEAEE
ncbi:CfrBI family restriction endonuclease [Candidatus Saccharibacteria bacterium]|nr:CfrBI family restriction endonuclease [Candidatus Saccharibacteria bacterium]